MGSPSELWRIRSFFAEIRNCILAATLATHSAADTLKPTCDTHHTSALQERATAQDEGRQSTGAWQQRSVARSSRHAEQVSATERVDRRSVGLTNTSMVNPPVD